MEINPICWNCKNYKPQGVGKMFYCLAFPIPEERTSEEILERQKEGITLDPKGIPDDILFGDNDHSKKVSGQVGDFLYEPDPEKLLPPLHEFDGPGAPKGNDNAAKAGGADKPHIKKMVERYGSGTLEEGNAAIHQAHVDGSWKDDDVPAGDYTEADAIYDDWKKDADDYGTWRKESQPERDSEEWKPWVKENNKKTKAINKKQKEVARSGWQKPEDRAENDWLIATQDAANVINSKRNK